MSVKYLMEDVKTFVRILLDHITAAVQTDGRKPINLHVKQVQAFKTYTMSTYITIVLQCMLQCK